MKLYMYSARDYVCRAIWSLRILSDQTNHNIIFDWVTWNAFINAVIGTWIIREFYRLVFLVQGESYRDFYESHATHGKFNNSKRLRFTEQCVDFTLWLKMMLLVSSKISKLLRQQTFCVKISDFSRPNLYVFWVLRVISLVSSWFRQDFFLPKKSRKFQKKWAFRNLEKAGLY